MTSLPPRRGLANRTARFAVRRVDAMFSRHGPAFKQLAVSWFASVGGDTLVTVALAGTLFFSVPTADARGNVALYLAITLAPFAVVAPLLGGLFSRMRGVYRAVLTTSAVLRTVLAIVMMLGLTTLWLYPMAIGMLVLSRLFGISKSSMLPIALPQPVALVGANALLARIGIVAGAVVLPLGAAAAAIEPALALAMAAGFFAVSAFSTLGLPDPREALRRDRELGVEEIMAPVVVPPPPRSLRLVRLATAGVRFINGYLLLLLAFEFRGANAEGLDFAALIAAGGAGYGLASLISPPLERVMREEPMVVAALAIEAAAAFVAGQLFSLGAAAALAA
ncbi:MAG TPA: hypothetical protein DCY40_07205, partial [Actinobacteria bacterium]|nr:hypothetical protein [Actinomycetota bacterium]